MAYKNREDQLEACRRHYASNKRSYLDRNKRRVSEFSRIIKEKKAVPCMDCGQQYPHYVMDFDHRDPSVKEFTIGMINRISSVKRLLAEIAKCDVVCSNCHRIRTYKHLPLV